MPILGDDVLHAIDQYPDFMGTAAEQDDLSSIPVEIGSARKVERRAQIPNRTNVAAHLDQPGNFRWRTRHGRDLRMRDDFGNACEWYAESRLSEAKYQDALRAGLCGMREGL